MSNADLVFLSPWPRTQGHICVSTVSAGSEGHHEKKSILIRKHYIPRFRKIIFDFWKGYNDNQGQLSPWQQTAPVTLKTGLNTMYMNKWSISSDNKMCLQNTAPLTVIWNHRIKVKVKDRLTSQCQQVLDTRNTQIRYDHCVLYRSKVIGDVEVTDRYVQTIQSFDTGTNIANIIKFL